MPNPNLPVPAYHGVLATAHHDRAAVRQAKALQRRANAVRATDAARRYVASGRMQDIGDLAEDALEIGGDIAAHAEAKIAAHPLFARELMGVASTGTRGLTSEIRSYIEDGR